jgi:hypothetical protein
MSCDAIHSAHLNSEYLRDERMSLSNRSLTRKATHTSMTVLFCHLSFAQL